MIKLEHQPVGNSPNIFRNDSHYIFSGTLFGFKGQGLAKVWMDGKKSKQTGRLRAPSLICLFLPYKNMPVQWCVPIFPAKVLIFQQNTMALLHQQKLINFH